MSNHHASGAPLHFSPLVGLGPYNQESSDGSNAKFITVRGDLAPGSSGSAHVDEHGRVTSVTSWGAQACFEGRSEASHKPSVDDLILISRNVRGLQEEE